MSNVLTPLLTVQDVTFEYRDRVALRNVSFQVNHGEIFGLLGPNGGGKTTLFRLLTTLLPLQTGEIEFAGSSIRSQAASIRAKLGVTFQSPSLDGKLTVRENLIHQGHLYGLRGDGLQRRITEVASWLGVTDRLGHLADTLSGGLKRRVEIAKSLLHAPSCLILDEPCTGLDPGARLDLWTVLQSLRNEQGMTILLTTHLMDEAERCDRLAILDRGQLVATGTPDEFRQQLGGDRLVITAANPQALSQAISERYGITAQVIDDEVRIEAPEALEMLRDLVTSFPTEIQSIALAKPTLEDVFIARTGHRFWE